MRRLYGASPLHLVVHLALLPFCAWALLELLGARQVANIVAWLVACVVLHDLVVLPLYSAGDRAMRRAVGGAINYLRVPAGLSLVLLIVFFGVIGERGEGAYHAVSGRDYEGYAIRWLLVTAALFAGSAALYRLRGGSRS